MLFKGEVVCGECYKRLADSPASKSIQPIASPSDPVSSIAYASRVYRRQPDPQIYYPPRVQTIEQTGKEWKAVIVGGSLVGFSGIPVVVITSQYSDPVPTLGAIAGIGLILFGIFIIVVGKGFAWWFHG